ncbi:MAG: hypothetical protein ACKOQX_11815, partial [Actinomycetota bacterium]
TRPECLGSDTKDDRCATRARDRSNMNGASVVLAAPAKLTLSLRVTGLRPDGFHLIDAEMVTLELADSLTVDTSRTGIEIVGAFAGDLAAELADDLSGNSKLAENNLVTRALKLEMVARRA